MGLLDYDLTFDWDTAEDDSSSAFDIGDVLDDSSSNALTSVNYDDLFDTTSTSFLDDDVWDWIEDADTTDYDYVDGEWVAEEIDKTEDDEFSIDDEEVTEEKKKEEDGLITGLLKKVPSSWWDKLLDLGVGGLKSWLKAKEKKDAVKKSSGGGSGRVAPVTAVKSAGPVGTRVKG